MSLDLVANPRQNTRLPIYLTYHTHPHPQACSPTPHTQTHKHKFLNGEGYHSKLKNRCNRSRARYRQFTLFSFFFYGLSFYIDKTCIISVQFIASSSKRATTFLERESSSVIKWCSLGRQLLKSQKHENCSKYFSQMRTQQQNLTHPYVWGCGGVRVFDCEQSIILSFY